MTVIDLLLNRTEYEAPKQLKYVIQFSNMTCLNLIEIISKLHVKTNKYFDCCCEHSVLYYLRVIKSMKIKIDFYSSSILNNSITK